MGMEARYSRNGLFVYKSRAAQKELNVTVHITKIVLEKR